MTESIRHYRTAADEDPINASVRRDLAIGYSTRGDERLVIAADETESRETRIAMYREAQADFGHCRDIMVALHEADGLLDYEVVIIEELQAEIDGIESKIEQLNEPS